MYENRLMVECLNDYEMTKAISLKVPDSKIKAPLISEDEMCSLVDFVKGNPEVEFISLPKVEDGADIAYMKDRLKNADPYNEIKFLAKIQSIEGLQNFESILSYYDGFKVDKDCLDAELTPEKAFIAQKYMSEKAQMSNKLVITSTEMFQSMECGTQPTRAEISMVSNAVLDGANYVMLSCETSKSEHVVDAI